MNVLLDTNVLVYYINSDGEYNKQATEILKNTEYNLFVSTKNITEFSAVLSKYKVRWDKILMYIAEITSIAKILYFNADCLKAFKAMCEKYKPKGNQIFDVEIASVVSTYEINRIATFNHKDFKEIREVRILEECIP